MFLGGLSVFVVFSSFVTQRYTVIKSYTEILERHGNPWYLGFGIWYLPA